MSSRALLLLALLHFNRKRRSDRRTPQPGGGMISSLYRAPAGPCAARRTGGGFGRTAHYVAAAAAPQQRSRQRQRRRQMAAAAAAQPGSTPPAASQQQQQQKQQQADKPLPPYYQLSLPVYSLATVGPGGGSPTLNLVRPCCCPQGWAMPSRSMSRGCPLTDSCLPSPTTTAGDVRGPHLAQAAALRPGALPRHAVLAKHAGHAHRRAAGDLPCAVGITARGAAMPRAPAALVWVVVRLSA